MRLTPARLAPAAPRALTLSHRLAKLASRCARRLSLISLAAALGACSTTPDAPLAGSSSASNASQHAGRASARRANAPSSQAATPPPRPPLPAVYGVPDAQTAVQRLVPQRVGDAAAWAADITNAFGVLRIPMSPENLCSVLAVIEQESSFQADPEVPNLPRIVMHEIETRRDRYSIPQFVVDKGLQRKSRDGRSYADRIKLLRTEADVSRLYEDVFSELPDLAATYQPKNPVRTAGAMQVNVAFAEEHVRTKPYPYGKGLSVRRESFTRRGGLYFGIALLFDYAAPYPSPLYRFADYNGGRFSSRNAAFQNAVALISRTPLTADGDLLIYQDGVVTPAVSLGQRALLSQAGRLGMSAGEIRRDLLLEKTERFANTPLWQKVFALADAQARQPVPRYAMPNISVFSPKFRRTLTTAGYAVQVEGRFNNCMTRQVAGRP